MSLRAHRATYFGARQGFKGAIEPCTFATHMQYVCHEMNIHLPYIYHTSTVTLPYFSDERASHTFTTHLAYVYHTCGISLPRVCSIGSCRALQSFSRTTQNRKAEIQSKGCRLPCFYPSQVVLDTLANVLRGSTQEDRACEKEQRET